MAIAGGTFATYAFGVAPRKLEVVRLRIALPGLPDALAGLRIAHLSDFHAGGFGVSERLLFRARELALEFEPEIIALTGDYVDGPVSKRVLGLLSAWPCNAQAVAVLGNHDYEHPDQLCRLSDCFCHRGVALLNNQARAIEVRGAQVWVVGVEDPFSLRADLDRAFAGLPDNERALLYLAHSPSGLAGLPTDRFRLMLSGHTHGGQIRLFPSGRVPFIRLLRWLTGERDPYHPPDRYRGVHRLGSALLVISNGIGTSQIPVRVRSHPQVILIELVPARKPIDKHV